MGKEIVNYMALGIMQAEGLTIEEATHQAEVMLEAHELMAIKLFNAS